MQLFSLMKIKKRRATVPTLVIILGYRQVTCTHDKHRTVHAL